MVENREEVHLRSVWLPTEAAAERLVGMSLEFGANQELKDERVTLAELALVTGDVEEALSNVPSAVPPDFRRRLRVLLQPWPEGRYTEAYKRSGGILNLFTPAWDEEQDEVWAAMVAEWEAGSYPDKEARQEALRELEQRWNRTPHPFFAGLTPAQVLVGGGAAEDALSRAFLEILNGLFEDMEFESEGEALRKTMVTLRSWQCKPQGRETPGEVIVAERDELLARRARVLEVAAGSS